MALQLGQLPVEKLLYVMILRQVQLPMQDKHYVMQELQAKLEALLLLVVVITQLPIHGGRRLMVTQQQ